MSIYDLHADPLRAEVEALRAWQAEVIRQVRILVQRNGLLFHVDSDSEQWCNDDDCLESHYGPRNTIPHEPGCAVEAFLALFPETIWEEDSDG